MDQRGSVAARPVSELQCIHSAAQRESQKQNSHVLFNLEAEDSYLDAFHVWGQEVAVTA